MHLAVNLPADVHYSLRSYAGRHRTLLSVAAAGAVVALAFVVVPAARGDASGAPPAAATEVTVAAASAPAEPVATAAASTPSPQEVAPAPAPLARPLFAAPAPGDRVSRVVIPSISVDHAVEGVGVDATGTMEAPSDGVRGVGWYADWATPGGGGNAVFSAHETWNLQRAPFYALNRLEAGDTLTLRMRSGAEYAYEVTSNRRYEAATMSLGQIIWPSARPDAEEWATFITCGGRFVRDANGYWDYLDRDVIVARRVS